ncbi:unnamed protein product [Effrenium voratum]|nr:unnamed protein product [Effrenium voratum]
MSHEVVMRWQRQKFCFRGQGFEVEHFDVAEAESSSSGEDEEAVRARRLRRDREARLQRCETELGACLWIDTNRAALQVLEDRGSYRGLRVLELGAGAGACGIATALDGADATVSDVDALLPLLQRNLELNQLRPEAGDEAPEEAREEEEATAKTKAKMRRAKAEKAAEKEPTESTAKGRRRRNAPSPRKKGSCQAVAIEWEKEALHPTLPEKAFDLIVVCDCLYENRDSWAALQALLARLLVPAESGAASSVVLASAELRRPFLEAFVAQLLEAGFTLLRREDGGRLGEVSVAILSRMDGTPVYQPVGGPASNGFTQAQSAPIGEHGPNEETLATPEAAQDCIPVEEQEITLTVPAIAQPGMKLQYRTPDGQDGVGVAGGAAADGAGRRAARQCPDPHTGPGHEAVEVHGGTGRRAPRLSVPQPGPASPGSISCAAQHAAHGASLPRPGASAAGCEPLLCAAPSAGAKLCGHADGPRALQPSEARPYGLWHAQDLMPQRHSYTPPPVSILERPSYTPMPQVLAGRPGSFQPPPVLSPSYVPPSNSWVPPVVLPYSQPGFGEVQPFPSQHAMPMWPPPDLLGLGGQLGHPGHPAPCPGFQREHFDPLLRTNFSQMSMQFPDYPPQMGPPQGMFQPQLGFNQGGMLGMHMHEVPLYGQKQPGMP